MPLKWKEQDVTAGMAPWIAKRGKMQLFVQPWYGDGIKWRGIIQHPRWTLVLTEPFSDTGEAMRAVEAMAENMRGSIGAKETSKEKGKRVKHEKLGKPLPYGVAHTILRTLDAGNSRQWNDSRKLVAILGSGWQEETVVAFLHNLRQEGLVETRPPAKYLPYWCARLTPEGRKVARQ